MKIARVVCASLALASGAALSERIIDPFERHEADYALQGPQHRSEVFYMSVNEVDTEGQQVGDDRFGDALLLSAGGLALGAVFAGRRTDEAPIATLKTE